jgi:betaine reductase
MIRIVHYLNQFFGQIGGEEKAGVSPTLTEGPIGPGILLNDLVKDEGEVVATVICGDNYFSENREEAVAALLKLITLHKPDALIAGPAFNAGRYGLACGEICKRVKEVLAIPVVTGVYPENPGADLYKKEVYMIATSNSAAGMRKAMALMVNLLMKNIRGEPIGKPSVEGYIPRGIKKNVLSRKLASQRAIEMLLRKIRSQGFQTEIDFPELDLVPPAAPIKNLGEARIALVTEGGLVPKGNPDNLQRARSTRYAKYVITNKARLSPEDFESIHRGFDTTIINEDPNRLVPLDTLRFIEQEGMIGGIYPQYFATSGVATTMENGKRIGKGIAKELKDAGVSGAIVIST